MPRNVNPGSITVGTGLAADDSIETNAFVNPTGGNEGLRAHITDPSRAHEARAVNLQDAGGYYASDHTEGALQEIAAGTSSTRLNGLIEGGTWTDVGLDITLDSPTTVLLNGVEASFGGQSVTLADNNISYLYVDASTGNLTSSTSLPALSTNPVLIYEITTVGGSVTASTDARFFVSDLDRKVPYTVRSSASAFNDRAEASFITMDAALWWLSNYANTGVSDDTEKHRLIIRGQVSTSTGVVIPSTAGGIILQGEGDAVILLTGGTECLTIASDRCEVRDLRLVANTASATGIYVDGSDLLVDNVQILTGSSAWGTGIHFHSTAGSRNRIRNCHINTAATYGIRFDLLTQDCVVENSVILGSGGSTNTGISCFTSATTATGDWGFSHLKNNRISGFDTGIYLKGNQYHISDCDINDAVVGIDYAEAGNSGADDVNSVFRGCRIRLDSSTAEKGIQITTTPKVTISGCHLTNPRAAGSYAGETVAGITVNDSDDVVISDCTINGFYNSVNSNGYGVHLLGATSRRAVVRGCAIEVAYYGVYVATSAQTEARISDTSMSSVFQGVEVEGADCHLTNLNINLDSSIGVSGIRVLAPRCRVIGGHITSARTWTAEADYPSGVYINDTDCVVKGVAIDNFDNDGTTPGGAGVYFDTSSVRSLVDGCTISDCYQAIYSSQASTVSDWTVSNCHFRTTTTGVVATGSVLRAKVLSNTFEVSSANLGVNIGNGSSYFTIQGNHFTGGLRAIVINGVDFAGSRTHHYVVDSNTVLAATDRGIYVNGYCIDGVISNNTVDGFLSGTPEDPTMVGCIYLEGSGSSIPSWTQVAGNNCSRAEHGIIAEGSGNGSPISDIKISGNVIHHMAKVDVGTDFLDVGTGISVQWSSRVQIVGNKIHRIGAQIDDAGTEGYPGTAVDVSSRGISFRTSSDLEIRDNDIRNLDVQVSGTGYGIHGKYEDETGPVIWDKITISGNTVVASTDEPIFIELGAGGGSGLHTLNKLLIENNVLDSPTNSSHGIYYSHSANSSSSETVIRGNKISSLGASGTGIFVYGDATATNDTGFDNLTITGNEVSVSCFTGIHLETIDGDSAIPLANVTISDNVLRDGGDNGITLNPDAQAISNVTISGNVITDFTGGVNRDGIYIATNGTGNSRNMTGLSITGNTLSNCTGDGIYLEPDGYIKQLDISNNRILSPGERGINMAESAVTVTGIDTDKNEDVRICDNQIIDPGTYGIAWSSLDGVKHRDVEISGNNIRGATGTGRGIDFSVTINITPGSDPALEQVFICNNRVEGFTGSAILLDYLSTQSLTVDSIRVDGNTCVLCNSSTDGQIIQVDLQGNVYNLSVSDNQIYNCGTGSATNQGAINLELGNDNDLVENVKINGNSIIDYTGAVGIYLISSDTTGLTLEGLQVNNNLIRNPSSGGGIDLFLSDYDTATNISVCGNTLSEMDVNNPGINVLTSSTGITRNLSINNNTITDYDQFAIRVFLDDNLYGLSICNNSMFTPSSSTGGVELDFDSSTSDVAEDIIIAHNTVTMTAASNAGGTAFNLDFSATIENVLLQGNIANGGTTGVDFNFGSAGTGDSLIVIGNTVRDFTVEVDDSAARWSDATPFWTGLYMIGNISSDAGTDGWGEAYTGFGGSKAQTTDLDNI